MPSYRRSFTYTLTTVSSLVGSEEVLSEDMEANPPGGSSSSNSSNISPDSEPTSVTLLTDNGPLEVCIVKSKAIPQGNGKFRCPVPDCDYGLQTRLRITRHFREDHSNYRSWRDVFLRKDAPHFVHKSEEKPPEVTSSTSSTNLEERLEEEKDCEGSPLDSLQRLVDSPQEGAEAPQEEINNDPQETNEEVPSSENAPPQPSLHYQPSIQPGFCPILQQPPGIYPQPAYDFQPPTPQYRVIQVLVPSRLLQAGPSLSPSPTRPYTLLPVQRVGSQLLPQVNGPRILLSSPHQTVPVIAPNPQYHNPLQPPQPQLPQVFPLYGAPPPPHSHEPPKST